MADCGAAGSALDRAVGAVTSNESSSAALKAISSFIGNVSNSTQHPVLQQQLQQQPMMMPAAPPEFISNPSVQHAAVAANRATIQPQASQVSMQNRLNSMDAAWSEGGQHRHLHHPHQQPMMMPNQRMGHPQSHPHAQMMQMQMQMQHQQMMYMNMQQQHMMQMQQQQNQPQVQIAPVQKGLHEEKLNKAWEETEVQQQSNQDIHASEAQTQAVNVTSMEQQTATTTEDVVNAETEERAWYESVESEFLKEMEHIKADGHEGLTQGATIEELAEAWENAQKESDWDDVYNNFNAPDPLSEPYQFHPDSSTLPQNSPSEHMAEGHRQFRAGQIQSAILSFEAAIQTQQQQEQTVHENDIETEAWHMLGKCHAENDQDEKAISCLERAVDRDPYHLDALLALGVSYVNELNNAKALSNLKMWVEHNPKFAGMEIEDDLYGTNDETQLNEDGKEMDQVQSLLLQALQWDPNDADVKEALGVCYNVSRDYDAAVDSLRHAVKIKPDDYQTWNKLGATLANSNRSEEALPAYLEAISLKPRYARAWLNMAISHSNLQNFEEAARCYLQTLSLNPSAGHCWSYLRIALTCMERWDLLPAVAAQDLKQLSGHFDFVQYE